MPDVPVADRRPGHAQRPARLPPGRGGRRAALRGRLLGPRPEESPDIPRDVAYVPKDGPLPEMYEPVESPVENLLHPKVKSNPMLKYPRVEVAPADRHGRQVPLRPDDLDRRRALVRRLDDAQHPVAERARSRAGARDARRPRPEARGQIGRLGQGLLGARRAHGEGARHAPHEAAARSAASEVTIVWMPYNWGFQGLSTGPSVNHLTIDAVGSRSGNAGDQGLPRQRGQGGRAGAAQEREAVMSDAERLGCLEARSDPDDPDRHHQLHRLPGLPGGLQAVERARGRGDRAAWPSSASRTRRR